MLGHLVGSRHSRCGDKDGGGVRRTPQHQRLVVVGFRESSDLRLCLPSGKPKTILLKKAVAVSLPLTGRKTLLYAERQQLKREIAGETRLPSPKGTTLEKGPSLFYSLLNHTHGRGKR